MGGAGVGGETTSGIVATGPDGPEPESLDGPAARRDSGWGAGVNPAVLVFGPNGATGSSPGRQPWVRVPTNLRSPNGATQGRNVSPRWGSGVYSGRRPRAHYLAPRWGEDRR